MEHLNTEDVPNTITIPPANHKHKTMKVIVTMDPVECKSADMIVIAVVHNQGGIMAHQS